MEIKIIDNGGIRQLLEFDFRKSEKNFEFNQVLELIRNTYRKQFEKIHLFFPKTEDIVFKINLEGERKSNTHTALARFEPELSIANEFVFHIYYTSIIEIANSIIGKSDFKNIQNDFENTILHELIHAADLRTLKETDAIKSKDNRLSKRESGFLLKDINEESYNFTTYWTFLSAVEMFRNEGIAKLGEKLCSNSVICRLDADVTEIVHLFQKNINQIVSLSSNLKVYHSLQNHTLLAEIKEIAMQSYTYGDVLMLVMLADCHKEKKELCYTAIGFLTCKHECKPTNNESVELLSLAIEMDMSEYLNAIIHKPFNTLENGIISRGELLQCCAIIQDDNNEAGISAFARTIGVHGYNKSRKGFISAMKNIVGYRMNADEIIELFTTFQNTESTEDIVEVIKKQGSILLPLAVNENNEIAQWALTYLLDDKDLIHDHISILGWQDDWLVLDAAIQLL